MPNKENEITLKEVFERVIILESKFDAAVLKGQKQQKPFLLLFVSIFIAEIFNFFLNYLIILEHNKIEQLLK